MASQTSKKTASTKVKNKGKVNSGPGFIEKNALKIALILGVIALILRIYRLGFLSLWVDEYMHALAAMKGNFVHGENNGIILTWFNTIFAAVFGNSEFIMRFPVALLGAATVPAVFVLGRQIANFRVGLMAAALTAFSLFLIFWSRVDRPYGMVTAFYVPLLLCFYMMLESVKGNDENAGSFGIRPKYLWLTLLAFLLAMLSQLICFLFLFTAGFYGTFCAIDALVREKRKAIRLNAYNVLFVLNILAVVLMFTPAGNNLMRPLIEIFLPGNIATLILPDMKAAIAAFETDKFYKSFDTYQAVLKYDFKNLYILGWLGIVLAFFKNRKLAYLLISGFGVPFFLMSFVFREPNHAKYLSYIYPVFLISIAYSLYHLSWYLDKYLGKSFSSGSSTFRNVLVFLFLFLLIASVKKDDIRSMLTTQNHGNIADKSVSEIHYVNWKQPSSFIKENRKDGDVVMATVQFAPRFYLGLDSVVWFRQMHYDAQKKEYVPNLPDGRKVSAYTYEQLVKTVEDNPRGWLLADYYFDNALTDPRARQFVEQNFRYHFQASDDGGVKVFSWDKSNPPAYTRSFLIELGKNKNQMASQPMTMPMNVSLMPPKVKLRFISEGIDGNSEVFVVINDKDQFAIKSNGHPEKPGENVIEVNSSVFRDGENKIQFGYNGEEGNGDVIKGCVIYHMDVSL